MEHRAPLVTMLEEGFVGHPVGCWRVSAVDLGQRVSTREGCPGRRGLVGPKGDKGYPGAMGRMGPPGNPGPAGTPGVPTIVLWRNSREDWQTFTQSSFYQLLHAGWPGLCGDPGEPGEKGQRGYTGEPGLQGLPGRMGYPGSDGFPGLDGKPGPWGLPGEQGLQGFRGDRGPAGEKGEEGFLGDPGPAGEKGAKGAKGLLGPKGVMGFQGPVGPEVPKAPEESGAVEVRLELRETWEPKETRGCLGSLAWRGRKDLSAPMGTRDLLATVGGQDAGETREKWELKACRDFQEKLVPRPCQVPLVHEVLLAPRAEREIRVLEGFQGCLAPPACGGWTASPGSLARQEKQGLLEWLVLLARLATRDGKVQTDLKGLWGGEERRVTQEIPGKLASVGWMGEAGTCGAPGSRGGPGEPGDAGPEGLPGRPGEQGKERRVEIAMEVRAQLLTPLGWSWGAAAAPDAAISPPGRVMLVMLESRVSQDRRDRRARSVSLELRDLLEPEDGLDSLERMESREMVANPVLRVQWVPGDQRAPPGSGDTLAVVEPEERQVPGESRAGRAWRVRKGSQASQGNRGRRAMWGVKGKKGSPEKLADGASEARWATGHREVPEDPRATQVARGQTDPRAPKDPMVRRAVWVTRASGGMMASRASWDPTVPLGGRDPRDSRVTLAPLARGDTLASLAHRARPDPKFGGEVPGAGPAADAVGGATSTVRGSWVAARVTSIVIVTQGPAGPPGPSGPVLMLSREELRRLIYPSNHLNYTAVRALLNTLSQELQALVEHPNGQYYIDPNQGSPRDALVAFCNFTAGGETCIAPVRNQVPIKAWLSTYTSEDTFEWFSTLPGGFLLEYAGATPVQLRFLRLHSRLATPKLDNESSITDTIFQFSTEELTLLPLRDLAVFHDGDTSHQFGFT
ncbi:PREDICTED: collagen alpha-1(II) chain-like, partial [Tauraco erythrolophus]|uniref:collagen alpha-1(II) chain-like n=1 Tax=Tauraco erythrolophus TaxID=121530 RepID=UPI000523A014